MTEDYKNNLRFCVIVPAYNEEGQIGEVVSGILKNCQEVIVVDDGSSDNTAAEADQAGALVIKHEQNRGKGVALETGFRTAQERGCEVAITLDADGQHDPEEVPKFIEAYTRTKIPVLIGNRMADIENMPLIRKLTNQFMSWMLSRTMGQYIPDTQCGYRLYRCDLIPFISTKSERFAAESEILLHIASRQIRMDSVRISTIYDQNRKSRINPLTDTYRFFSMIKNYRHKKKYAEKSRN